MKGLLALDIDGTITAARDSLSNQVITYLQELSADGYTLLFVTGRTLHWGLKILEKLNVPFYLAPYNGSLVVSMPSHLVINVSSMQLISKQETFTFLERHHTSGVLYELDGHKEVTLYCPSQFNEHMLEFLERRRLALEEKWLSVSLQELRDRRQKAIAIRVFAKSEEAIVLASQCKKEINTVHAAAMIDSVNPGYRVVQITALSATKAHAVDILKKKYNFKGPVIAAGDDFNDIPLLEAADVAIVMDTAPSEVKALADIIAPSAMQNGIIHGLKAALR